MHELLLSTNMPTQNPLTFDGCVDDDGFFFFFFAKSCSHGLQPFIPNT